MENCQNNNLRPQQKKILKDHLCHILGLMIKKYNHSYGACVMIVQTLPHYEHFSALYADLIQTCVTQLGYESILPDLLREFRHSTSNASSDNNLKYYSQFLIDLADRWLSEFDSRTDILNWVLLGLGFGFRVWTQTQTNA